MNRFPVSVSDGVRRRWWCCLGHVALAAVAVTLTALPHVVLAQGMDVPYRVGFLGQPASCEPTWIRRIEWNRENISKLKDLGFNVIQVDVAWTRPDDEILCIEDIVELTAAEQNELPQPVPLRSRPGADNLVARQETLRQRIVLAKEAGLRTLLLVGAPTTRMLGMATNRRIAYSTTRQRGDMC